MLGRIIMDIVQPRQIGCFIGKSGISHVVPNSSANGIIEPIQFSCRNSMYLLREFLHATVNRIKSNQMIMIWKDRPGLKLKIKLQTGLENHALK